MTGLEPSFNLFLNENSFIQPNWPKNCWLLWVLICTVYLTMCYYTGQMIELCLEYLSAQCIWLYVIIMSHTCFRVNLHSIVARMSRSSLVKINVISKVCRCCCCYFRYRASFEQGVIWYSSNYRVQIHPEMHRWHDDNTQSYAPYR